LLAFFWQFPADFELAWHSLWSIAIRLSLCVSFRVEPFPSQSFLDFIVEGIVINSFMEAFNAFMLQQMIALFAAHLSQKSWQPEAWPLRYSTGCRGGWVGSRGLRSAGAVPREAVTAPWRRRCSRDLDYYAVGARRCGEWPGSLGKRRTLVTSPGKRKGRAVPGPREAGARRAAPTATDSELSSARTKVFLNDTWTRVIR
jgi:hypothetical protein